jgi:CBS domain-containing protein
LAAGGSASVDLELNLTTESVSRAHLLALVCRDGALVGIFTERDALRLMARGGNLDVSIESVMVREPATIHADATVADAIARMTSGGFRRLPIIDGNRKPIGVVQVASIVHYLVEHFPKTIYNQPAVSHPATQHREGP